MRGSTEVLEALPLGRALRTATPFPLEASTIDSCLDEQRDDYDALFRRARTYGLASIGRADRSGHLWRVVGEVAEAVAEIILDELGYTVFWHITEPGVHGVDLLFLSPDDAVLALEVKGTLRAGAIPRLTPSRLKQMSREWLNQPDNPALNDWELEADDLYAGVMVVDLATPSYRIVLSSDFETYQAVASTAQLEVLRALDRDSPSSTPPDPRQGADPARPVP
jgi:hypothetical protein